MAGNFGGPMVQRAVLAPKGTFSALATATWDSAVFYNDFAQNILIVLEREAQVSTTVTFDAKPMWRMSESHDWISFADGAGNEVTFETWADTDVGVKQVLMGLGPLGGDADEVLAADASTIIQTRRYGGILIPTEMIIRFSQTNGAAKQNRYGCTVYGQG